jgi:hypothetical protein
LRLRWRWRPLPPCAAAATFTAVFRRCSSRTLTSRSACVSPSYKRTAARLSACCAKTNPACEGAHRLVRVDVTRREDAFCGVDGVWQARQLPLLRTHVALRAQHRNVDVRRVGGCAGLMRCVHAALQRRGAHL